MSTLFSEMDRANNVGQTIIAQQHQQTQQNGNNLEEQRALQLAFELSMLGLSDTLNGINDIGVNVLNQHHHQQNHHHNQQQQQQQQQQQHQQQPLNSPNGGCMLSAFSAVLPNIEDRSKKSQNMTECVPVPSSEHVAEIVGRQGCKIKALRAKTNTYIKTPVRGEEPVFVVTGRKEDVAKAKREILSAAEHFSLIRASRKPTIGGNLSGKGTPPGPPTNIPGQITIQVRVPYRVVGLVVGPKGATIKHIQQQTHTYIVTPSRDKEPVFEVTGMPDNVQSARRQIEAHIALRTGNTALNQNGLNTGTNGLDCTNGGLLCDDDLLLTNGSTNPTTQSTTTTTSPLTTTPELLASLYKNGLVSLFGYLDQTTNIRHSSSSSSSDQQQQQQQQQLTNNNQFVPMPSSTGSSTCDSSSSSSSSSASSTTSSKSAIMTRPELINIWKSLGESIDCDEGLGESPNIWSMPTSNILCSRTSPSSATSSASPTDSLLAGSGNSGNNVNGSGGNGGINNVLGNNLTQLMNVKRECLVCGDREVTAALVPCGHNMFCFDCANRICGTNDSACPICSQTVIQAIRIIV